MELNTDEISAPQAVIPVGSTMAATIPILEAEDASIAASDSQGVQHDHIVEHGKAHINDGSLLDEQNTPAVQTSGVTIVDDSIIHPRNPALPIASPSMDTSAAENAHQIDEIMPAPGDTVAENPISVESELGQVTAHLEAAQVPSDLPTGTTLTPALGLPPGVDLQKLLSSFSNPGSIVAIAPKEAVSSETADPRLSATTATAISPAAVLSPTTTAVDSTPSVPWQARQAPVSVSQAPSQPSDDAVYEQFLVDEKRIMGNTAPHEFEPGSRLFVGNMSIETTSKRQVFFIFKKYGKLAQVSLKTTYGFVQFLTSRECRAAMEGEQGLDLGGKKLHLEVSKPQPSRGAAAATTHSRRRSRSPARRSQVSQTRDVYESYGRSPPPRRSSPGRYHVQQDSQYSARRSPSPRRHAPVNDDTPLPPRYGSQVPEVQIVVPDEADRSYIYWVESSIRQASIKVETLFLSPRLGLPAVVRQMAKEGVLAIVQCDRHLQMVNKVSLQVFDRSQGHNNVRFDEYAGLDISTAIGLLRRSQQQAMIVPRAAPQQANLAAMIAQMDPASLQQVIGALSQQQQQQQQPPYPPPSSNYSSGQYPYRR